MKEWIAWWYKDLPYIRYSESYWRAQLVYHTLLASCSAFLFLAVLNALVFSATEIALIDAAGAVLSIAVYGVFRRTQNIDLAAWLLSITITIAMIIFFLYVKGAAYSLVWATIIPPFTFFLLGRAGGSILSAITFSVCIYLVYIQYKSNVSITVTKGAVFNVMEAAFIQILLFRFYEGTRHKAFLELQEEHKESKRKSEVDYLTGVYNRAKFLFLARELLAENNAGEHCIVILDIDDFKLVNDKFGHGVGDDVLKKFAQTLKNQIREKDVLARWGGEEFVLLLTNVSSIDAKSRIEAILDSQALNVCGHGRISFSAGVTQCRRGSTIDEMVRYADTALYQAKNNGKRRVIIYAIK